MHLDYTLPTLLIWHCRRTGLQPPAFLYNQKERVPSHSMARAAMLAALLVGLVASAAAQATQEPTTAPTAPTGAPSVPTGEQPYGTRPNCRPPLNC